MLTTKRLTIEPVKKKDLPFFRTLRNDQTTSFYLTDMTPINEHMQEEWFRTFALNTSKMYLTISDHAHNPVGIVRCDEWDRVNRSIRIGIDIECSHRKQGFAEESYRAFIPYLFHKLNIHRIWLLVLEYNEAAISLYSKLGFQIEGKQKHAIFRDGSYHDYFMMSMIIDDYDKTI